MNILNNIPEGIAHYLFTRLLLYQVTRVINWPIYHLSVRGRSHYTIVRDANNIACNHTPTASDQTIFSAVLQAVLKPTINPGPGIPLVTWINFNPNMDKWSHAMLSGRWNYLSTPKFQRLHRWNLGVDM